MAIEPVYLKVGDRLPALEVTLSDEDGPLDLTGATVTFNMARGRGSGASAKIDGGACTLVDENNGVVSYAWASGDTDTAGSYQGEFVVSISGGEETFPNHEYIPIEILSRLA